MATVREHLHTWNLKHSATKTVSEVFHLNNKEAKRELQVKHNNATLRFCSTYHRHLESLRKKLTSHVTILEAACWSSKVANNHLSPGPFSSRVLRSCLVQQCSRPPHWPCHQRRLTNCDWMPASYTSWQPSYSCKHPACWASSQRSHTVSSQGCGVGDRMSDSDLSKISHSNCLT